MISTEHGLRAIETLKKDDLVWSRDEQSGKTELKPIVQLFQHQAPATLVLTFSNGERIETTKGIHAHQNYGSDFGVDPKWTPTSPIPHTSG